MKDYFGLYTDCNLKFIVAIAFVGFIFAISCHTESKSSLNDGKVLYKNYCVNCHGIDGSLKTNGAIDLRHSSLTLDEKILVITNGRNVMTSFENQLTPEQIKAVASYTEILKQFKANEH